MQFFFSVTSWKNNGLREIYIADLLFTELGRILGIAEPIDRVLSSCLMLVESYKSKTLQGGWKSLAHRERINGEEYEEERYVVRMSNGKCKEFIDLKPF